MFVICFYVPKAKSAQVKEAMFQAGAGQIGLYSHCAFEVQGVGQFKPLTGSMPAIGQIDSLEYVEEVKVEMACQSEKIHEVISAMKAAHPYEEVAFHIIRSVDLSED
ncbi:MAG: hypothetical protein KDD61_09225 [Bdellovibrionales bacterium]|nr:hypothetical protein [Bdellovibrionales bacterium]